MCAVPILLGMVRQMAVGGAACSNFEFDRVLHRLNLL